jgi:hypothetical protein
VVAALSAAIHGTAAHHPSSTSLSSARSCQNSAPTYLLAAWKHINGHRMLRREGKRRVVRALPTRQSPLLAVDTASNIGVRRATEGHRLV